MIGLMAFCSHHGWHSPECTSGLMVQHWAYNVDGRAPNRCPDAACRLQWIDSSVPAFSCFHEEVIGICVRTPTFVSSLAFTMIWWHLRLTKMVYMDDCRLEHVKWLQKCVPHRVNSATQWHTLTCAIQKT
jgi:hypothetical protein